jgi:hypothetical protein
VNRVKRGRGRGGAGLNSIACHSFYAIFKIELFPLEKNVYIPKEVPKKKVKFTLD